MFILLFVSCISSLYSQTQASSDAKIAGAPNPRSTGKVASIKSFRIIQEKDGPAVEILSTKPLVPAIQVVHDPPRLVIDLANARIDTPQKRIDINADQISSLRADQFHDNPPVVRIVVDLLAPRTYTWDTAGNRLVVHLGQNPTEANSSPFEQPALSNVAPHRPVVAAVRALGPLAISDDTGNVGSSFSAGADTAILRLSSGGEVHVCPGTTISITPSEGRHNLMFGMNTGAIETHLTLDASTDSVMTPDFRVLLVGPGEFHYAFSTDNQGNTCVRSLPGNVSPVIVNEVLGDRSFQVRETDQLVFRGGQLDRIDMNVPLECGCPPPRQLVERAAKDLPVQTSQPGESTRVTNQNSTTVQQNSEMRTTATTGVPARDPGGRPHGDGSAEELHVQISAPFVFNPASAPPAPVEDVRALPPDMRQSGSGLNAAPMPPTGKTAKMEHTEASASPAAHHGFFRKIGNFFASIFR